MKSTPRTGFAMIVAIVLIGLIGVALAALTEQVGYDLKRLRVQTDTAQCRQILIAATNALQRDPDKTVILPPALLENGAALKISPVSRQAGRAIVHCDALCGKTHLSEILTLTPTPAGWNIADAQLQ